jgi:hypothetical protein
MKSLSEAAQDDCVVSLVRFQSHLFFWLQSEFLKFIDLNYLYWVPH